MEFEDHEEQEEELCMGAASYDSLPNSSRVKMPGGSEAIMVTHPLRNIINNNNGNSNSNNNNNGNSNNSNINIGVGNGKARYRECLKNHAVGIGGHALDGCGEFMPAGNEGSLESLKCAACNCHRNFHRKESPDFTGDPFLLTHHHHHALPQPQFAAYYRTPAGYLHVSGQQRTGTLALPSTSGGGGGGTQSTREDQDEDVSNPSGGGSSKKRHRTKFTPEQKDKMLELAEKLGWRIQKHDEGLVQEFCNESGVKRHVLKVWMHNNKHTLGKKP